MSELSSQECIPCKGGIAPMTAQEIENLMPQLAADWSVITNHHLFRAFEFADFAQGLTLVNAIGALAEEQGHHPDLTLAWGKVTVTMYTHAIDGLALSDFVLAAKIDDLG